jgi:hypothetical protein
MAINQLTTANTFQHWLTATSALISTANTLTDGNGATFIANTKLDVSGSGSTLNVRTSSGINQLYVNTGNLLIANVTSLVGTSNTAIYAKIEAAESSALAFSIALG